MRRLSPLRFILIPSKEYFPDLGMDVTPNASRSRSGSYFTIGMICGSLPVNQSTLIMNSREITIVKWMVGAIYVILAMGIITSLLI